MWDPLPFGRGAGRAPGKLHADKGKSCCRYALRKGPTTQWNGIQEEGIEADTRSKSAAPQWLDHPRGRGADSFLSWDGIGSGG